MLYSSQGSNTIVADRPWFPDLLFPSFTAWIFDLLALFLGSGPCLSATSLELPSSSSDLQDLSVPLLSGCCPSETERSSLVSMKTRERRRETQAQYSPEPFTYYSFPIKWAGPYCFPVTATLKKAGCFWNQSNRMWAKFLGGERTGTAAAYMSYSGGLPQIFSTNSLGALWLLHWQTKNLLCLTKLQSPFWSDIHPTPWRIIMHCYCSWTFSDSVPGPYCQNY